MSENPESLSPSEWKLLRRGMDMYLDLLLDDLGTVLNNEPLKDTLVFREVLPPQFTSWYTPLFLKQFVVCAVHLAAKIDAWDGAVVACAAEELAFRGLIEWIPTLCEADIIPGTIEHLGDFREEAVDDFDVDMLFDLTLDGIEHDETLNAQLGLDSLRPENWFRPFSGHRVHPYCRNDQAESD